MYYNILFYAVFMVLIEHRDMREAERDSYMGLLRPPPADLVSTSCNAVTLYLSYDDHLSIIRK